MTEFVIVDTEVEIIDSSSKVVNAHSPEQAAKMALGLDLVRSGAKQNLRARVYFQRPGQPTNMVRLYTRLVKLPEIGTTDVR